MAYRATEIRIMGKTQVAAVIENLEDRFKAEGGSLPADEVRRVEVADALADTGAVMLAVPKRLIAQLGLKPFGKRRCEPSRASSKHRSTPPHD